MSRSLVVDARSMWCAASPSGHAAIVINLFSSLMMKTRPYKFQRRIPYVVLITPFIGVRGAPGRGSNGRLNGLNAIDGEKGL
jgi:hypothetical protein